MSADQSMQTYFTVFAFCQALIFKVTFEEKNILENNLVQRKILLTSQELFFSVLSLLALFQR